MPSAETKTSTKPAPKKGKATWAPATALTASPIEGHRIRWTNKDPMNMQRKEAEGWAVVGPDHGIKSNHEHPGDLASGKPLTSVNEYRELVLMAIPEETAQARDAHYTARTDAQSAGLVSNLKNNMASGGAAEVHGKIIIE